MTDWVTLFFQEHPYLSGLAVEVSGSLLDKAIGWAGRKVFPKKTDLEKLISTCFEQTIIDVRDSIGGGDDDHQYIYQKHFFKSSHFARLLVEASLTDRTLDPFEVLSLAAAGDYHYKLSEENVRIFINVFKKNLAKDPSFAALKIKETYPFRIFRIDAKLDQVVNELKNDQSLYEQRIWVSSASAIMDANFVDSSPWSRVRESILLDDLYIRRNLEDEIIEQIGTSDVSRRIYFISGDAGNGKTSLLWSMYNHYKSNNQFYPVFIKAVQLKQNDYSSFIQFATGKLNEQLIVFIDTIDLLLHQEADRQRLIDFFTLLQQYDCICIASSRPQELTSLASLRGGFDYGVYKLDNYDIKTELPRAIRRYATIYYENLTEDELPDTEKKILEIVSDDRSMLGISLNPLTNRMLFSIYAPDELPGEINVFKLYGAYWNGRVLKDQRAGTKGAFEDFAANKDLSNTAHRLAFLMLSNGEITVNQDTITRIGTSIQVLPEDIEILVSRGVLKKSASTGDLEFFHQTFFEHVSGRAFLNLAKLKSIPLLAERIAGGETHTDKSLFYGPILEQLLLLCEGTPYSAFARNQMRAMLMGGRPDQLRSAFYVYALQERNDPELTDLISHQFDSYHKIESVYLKRFVRIAANMNKERLSELFPILKKIWIRGLWNEQSNLIELLSYVVNKNPALVCQFIKEIGLTALINEQYRKMEKREHLPVTRHVVSILVKLNSEDTEFISGSFLDLLKNNDITISREIVTELLQGKIPDAGQVLLRNITAHMGNYYYHKNYSNEEGTIEIHKMMSTLFLADNSIRRKGASFFVQQLDNATDKQYNTFLYTISILSPELTSEEAERIFRIFLNEVKVKYIFFWTKWLISYLPLATSEGKNYLDGLFFAHMKELLQKGERGEPLENRERLIHKSYTEYFYKLPQEMPQKAIVRWEDYYKSRRYISFYPGLFYPLITAYISGDNSAANFLYELDDLFFSENEELSLSIIHFIMFRQFEDVFLNRLFLRLAIMHKKIKELTTFLDKLGNRDGVFIVPENVPVYIKEFKPQIYHLIEAGSRHASARERIGSAHLLASICKLEICPEINLVEINRLFGGERNNEVKSWIVDLYSYCKTRDSLEAISILEFIENEFENPLPNIKNKARCSYLNLIYRSEYDLSACREKMLISVFDRPETDLSGLRYKYISRVLYKYAVINPDTGFYLFVSLLTSQQFRAFKVRKQNEVAHDLHNGCIQICRVINADQLNTLVSYLFNTNCHMGRLILAGISFDKSQLEQINGELVRLKEDSRLQPCIRDQIHSILEYKFRNVHTETWPELLNFCGN